MVNDDWFSIQSYNSHVLECSSNLFHVLLHQTHQLYQLTYLPRALSAKINSVVCTSSTQCTACRLLKLFVAKKPLKKPSMQ